MTELRTWDFENPDIDADDYIIGSTLGWWTHDDDSMAAATVIVLANVLIRAGVDEGRAAEIAADRVFPDEEDGEQAFTISVERDEDEYRIKVDFTDEDGDQ